MTPEEIQGDYDCSISVDGYRIGNKKAEYKVVTRLSFYSSRAHATASTSWHIWRSFTSFRKLDEQLRQKHSTHMKGIQFPPLHRRRVLFRTHLNEDFITSRQHELDTYLKMVTRNPALVSFHVHSVQSQTLRAFVGFHNGFGANASYEAQNASLRPSVSKLATPEVAMQATRNSANNLRATQSVMGDDDDDFRSVSSFSTMSSFSSSVSQDYRWSGTGFRGSQSFYRASSQSSFVGASLGPHSAPLMSVRSSVSDSNLLGRISSAPAALSPEQDLQRANMEVQLGRFGLVGVSMPPDGSCFLHCIVYEMYPLQCLKPEDGYTTAMMAVNVGDSMAPRRVAAARNLRTKLMEYALEHVDVLAKFLLQEPDELKDRFETFRDTPDEQATINEIYAAASMFNLEIVLVSNDESFQIDPVMPVDGLPSIRQGPRRTVTLGYLIPTNGLPGHYICTREQRGTPANSFASGTYRGSLHVSQGPRCSAVESTVNRASGQVVE